MTPALGPALRSVEDSQDDYLFLANFVDGDEGEWRKRNLARPSNATNAPEVRKRLQCPDALDNGPAPRVAQSQDVPLRCSRRSVRDHPRHPPSSGRASAAVAPINASSHVIVVDQPAFTCGGATLLDFAVGLRQGKVATGPDGRNLAAGEAGARFATPKSRTFGRSCGVIMMLDGLRSRWMMPAVCAA